MNYFIIETDKCNLISKTAGVKARMDVETILDRLGFSTIEVSSAIYDRDKLTGVDKIKTHYELYLLWKKKLDILKKDDWVYIQFPLIEHTVMFALIVKRLEKKGIHVCMIIHDVESIRLVLREDVSFKQKFRLKLEETNAFKKCSKVIVHNDKMKFFMNKRMKVPENKMVVLGIFDYLIYNYDSELMNKRNMRKDGPVIIAGALSKHKAGYIYQLPNNSNFNLYGVNYERIKVQENVNYMGAYDPVELPYILQGSFGLVWDGDSINTCAGIYGTYLKINNPHKISLYLASEIPVIIWEGAALADFVKKHQCGITVKSLTEISKIIDQISEEEYRILKYNAVQIGQKLREGYFLKKAILAK